MECCGDHMIVIFNQDTGDYVYLVEWKIGRITQARSLIAQSLSGELPDDTNSFEKCGQRLTAPSLPSYHVIRWHLPRSIPLSSNFASSARRPRTPRPPSKLCLYSSSRAYSVDNR